MGKPRSVWQKAEARKLHHSVAYKNKLNRFHVRGVKVCGDSYELHACNTCNEAASH